MHTHRLKLPIHEAFLREERHDPVTGDAFREGDEVVFCASCRSAFLKSSWEYMGGAHCGQENTLAKIPYAQAIDVKKGVPFKDDLIVFSNYNVEGEKVAFNKKSITSWATISASAIRIVSIIFFVFLLFKNLNQLPYSLIILFPAWSFDRFIRKNLNEYNSDFFALGEKYVHLYNEKIPYRKVEYICVQMIEKEDKNEAITYITFHITIISPGKTHEFKFRRPKYSIARAKLIYTFLEVAQEVTVYFKSPYEEDKLLVKSLQREYEGDLRFFEEE